MGIEVFSLELLNGFLSRFRTERINAAAAPLTGLPRGPGPDAPQRDRGRSGWHRRLPRPLIQINRNPAVLRMISP